MIKSYWRIAWRNIARNKVYTVINILGLALGICGCIVLFLITHYEFSFDREHPDGDRIFRIVGDMQRGSGETAFLNSPYDDLAGFESQITGFAATAGVHTYSPKIGIPQPGGPAKTFDSRIPGAWSNTAVFITPGWFQVFRYDWLAGSPAALDRPNAVVLTENRARLYFGDLPAARMIGKTVLYDDSLPVQVSGIVKDWKGNTDIGFTDFISVTTATHSFLRDRIPTADWTSLQPHRSMAFVKLLPGVRPEQVNARFAAYIRDHVKFQQAGSKLTMYLQALTAMHFTNDFHRGDDGDDWRKPYLPTLYAMMGVAVFILLIAVVNFVNLSTAQSMARAKEVGVRRVMGGRRWSIRWQFGMETLIVVLVSVVAAILLVNPVLALFHDFVPEGVQLHLFSLSPLGFLVGMTALTTLLAGSYPAWVLSAYNPVKSLKGGPASEGGRGRMRRGLIVFQFVISLVFIIGSLVIGKQIAYMDHADKGFHTDRVLTLTDWNDPPAKLQLYAHSLKDIPGIEQVLLEGNPPMGFAQASESFSFRPTGNEMHEVSAHIGNDSYIPFYGMRLIAGRNMLPGDSMRELVVNVTMTRLMGCRKPADAIGRMLYSQAPMGGIGKGHPVVGVVADFHVSSFHEPIPPVVIENVAERKQNIALRLAPGERDLAAVKAVIDQLEARWKQQFPDRPFRSAFLDESISWLFGQERKTAWLVNMAMGVTVFISCMGLFGLGLFTVRRRAKEISIRKVLGASVRRIVSMLSRDFAVLVGLAFFIAAPLAGFFANRWLQDFEYRTALSWYVFVIAGAGALVLALLTVGLQAVRAAMVNPVTALRSE